MAKQQLTIEQTEILEAIQALVDAAGAFLAGWQHFLSCINFFVTYLDADAIMYMNEVPGNVNEALQNLARIQKKYHKEVTPLRPKYKTH